MVLNIKKLREDAIIPEYGTGGSAGLDLTAVERQIAPGGGFLKYHTGLALEIPEGYEGQIRPRSSIAKNTDLILINSPGTIDSDYRGEIIVVFKPIVGVQARTYKPGDRIAQLVINKVEKAEIVVTHELSETERGEGGFGSTGQ